jgi:hypothetical protein
MLLTIPEAHAELYEAIESIPARHRAERIRTLATIGLASLRGRVAAPAAVAESISAITTPAPEPAAPVGSGVKRDRAKKLADSM